MSSSKIPTLPHAVLLFVLVVAPAVALFGPLVVWPNIGRAGSLSRSEALVVPPQSSSASARKRSDQPFGSDSRISNHAYTLINRRAVANRVNFFVYQDVDSAFNHGFPSGEFGDISKITVNPACIDALNSTGCSTDPNRLDLARGTVLQIAFAA